MVASTLNAADDPELFLPGCMRYVIGSGTREHRHTKERHVCATP